MIISYLVLAVLDFLNALFSWLPQVTALPTVFGFNSDTALSTVFGYWNGFIQVVWPLEIVWYWILFYYFFRISLLGLKFILGQRVHF